MPILLLPLGTGIQKVPLPHSYTLTDFDFTVVFLIAYHFLSHLCGITVKLQSSTIDIIDAYQQIIDEIKTFYTEIREKTMDEFHKV